jgi:hypothetical protein
MIGMTSAPTWEVAADKAAELRELLRRGDISMDDLMKFSPEKMPSNRLIENFRWIPPVTQKAEKNGSVTPNWAPVTDQQYAAMSPLEQQAYSSRQSNKYLNEQYARQSPNAPVAGLMPSMGQVTSEVKDYWKDPAAYTESMGGPSISNMGGYMGGGKSFGQNLSQGNYGQALGQTLGAVPDYAVNSLISAGVDTGSGVSNLARGNVGTGIKDLGWGAAKTWGNMLTAGGSLALKAAPAVGKYGAPLLLNTGKALSPLIKAAPKGNKIIKAMKRVAFPIVETAGYGVMANDITAPLMKSGWEMPGIVKDVGTIIKHIPEFVRGESPWQTNAPWTGRSGNQTAPAPAPPVAAPAPVVPAAPPPPAVVPAPAVDDTEEDPISAGITRGVKGLAGGINKALDTYNYWMGPKQAPPPVEMAPYKPMGRTNLEYLQGANDSNQAWAHPMMGNENQISYGHMGDTIKSTIGTLFPSFKIGKPDMEAFTKSVSYAPGYKLDTSKL